MPIETFLEEKINKYAGLIVKQSERSDDLAMGQLTFYLAMRRVLTNKGTMQDLGMMDAINDTLQQLGRIPENVTFYK